MANYFQLNVVSAEAEIFSGFAEKLFVTGVLGELEILYNHAPLLTSLSPGPLWIFKKNGEEEGLVIQGGMLEVQPTMTTVLADVVLRAKDIDQEAAIRAKAHAEAQITHPPGEGFDYARAHSEIMSAVAQLRVLHRLKQLKKKSRV